MKRNNTPIYLKFAFCFSETCTTYAFMFFVYEREITDGYTNPDYVAVLLIFMTSNTQSLRIFTKKANTLCILELKLVSFTGSMKYVK